MRGYSLFHFKKIASLIIVSLLIVVGCTRKAPSDEAPPDLPPSATLVSMSVIPQEGSLAVGMQLQLLAKGRFSNNITRDLLGGVSWTSSAPDIATVDSAGTLKALAVGPVIITAKSGGQTASVTLQIVPVTLQAITVSPVDRTIFVKEKIQFTANGSFNDDVTPRPLTKSEVVWSSSDTSIATVDENGMVTGSTTAGTTTIKAKAVSSAIEGSTLLTLKDVTLLRISLSTTGGTASMIEGTTKTPFSAIGVYSSGLSEDFTSLVVWNTSDAQVVTFASGGVATAHAPGSVTVSATYQGKTGSALLNVVAANMTSLVIDPVPALAIGKSESLHVRAGYDNGTTEEVTAQAEWASLDSNIIVIDNSTNKGNAFPKAEGTVTLQATYKGQLAQMKVTVINGTLQAIVVTAEVSPMAQGTTQQFNAQGTYDSGFTLGLNASVTWSSSNTSVATISPSGQVKGESPGTTTITASFGTIHGTTSLTVTAATISSMVIMPSSLSIYIGEKQNLQALGDFNGSLQPITADVEWTSDNPGIATIDALGNTTGNKDGLVLIHAGFPKANPTTFATTTLTVKPAKLNSIRVDPSELFLPVGSQYTLTAKGTYSDGFEKTLTQGVSWTSVPTSVATVVPSSGVVTAQLVGSATVTATQGNLSGGAKLTVNNAKLLSLSVIPTTPSIPVGIKTQFTAVGNFNNGTAQDLTSLVSWSIVSSTIATVDKGLVKGLVVGTTAVMATYFDQTGSTTGTATLTVNGAQLSLVSVNGVSLLGKDLTRQYNAIAHYTDTTFYDVTDYEETLFSSDNGGIISTTPKGLATGVSKGQTRIKASFLGKEGFMTIEVKDLILTSISVTPANASVPQGGTQIYTATGHYASGDQEDLTLAVAWSLSPYDVATVGQTGLVTGNIAYGSATLRATFSGIVGETTVSVGGAAPKDLVGGKDHTCAVMTNDTLKCWGKNFSGQLGINSKDNKTAPELILNETNMIGVSAGEAHTCALLTNKRVKCWGSNKKGQLGTDDFTDRSFPTTVSSLDGAMAIATGGAHTCAILSNNTVNCWGDNSAGQLGLGNTSGILATSSPIAVSNITHTPRSITAGLEHTCLLYQEGFVACWGKNDMRQLGIGTTVDASSPILVPGLTTATAITAGGKHTCALLLDKTVRCWGNNASGQLGDNSTATSTQPVTVGGLSSVALVLAGESYTCAQLENGNMKCWGANQRGQLGDGSLVDQKTPVDVIDASGVLSGVVDIAVGGSHTCALLSDRSSRCWGSNLFGQVGNSKFSNASVPTLMEGASVVDGYAGTGRTCILISGGAITCRGDNRFGQLGDGTTVGTEQGVNVIGLTTATSTAMGENHTCALLSDGTVQCWGANYAGQLGNGTSTSSSTPVTVSNITTSQPAQVLSAGREHTCVVLLDKTVQCWGNNTYDQLGNPAFENSMTPIAVVGISNAVSVAAGSKHTCALLRDLFEDTVTCWGDNASGQLGDSTNTPSSVPQTNVELPNTEDLTNVVSITSGEFHSCALVLGGSVECWGENNSGQLGNGETTDSSVAVTVVGLGPPSFIATAITAGNAHTCALLADKTVTCWGNNARGQLGTGDTENSSTPKPVQNLSGVTSIYAGGFNTCARLTDSTVKCWGDAFYGQLGNGVVFIEPLPVSVNGI